jgi:Zn-dependent protease with chaperone function
MSVDIAPATSRSTSGFVQHSARVWCTRVAQTLAIVLVLLVGSLAQARVVSIVEPSLGLAFTESQVIAQSETAKAALLARARDTGHIGCVDYCQRLDAVWRSLLPVLESQRTGRLVTFALVVVTLPDVNALSFPDGTVVVSEDFIRRMQLGPAELAFVLAHEAVHVLLQHERQTLTSMLALIPSRAQRTPQDVYTEMEFNYFAMADSMSLVFHQVEREADELGLQLAALAGYTPRGQMGFIERAALQDQGQSMVSTHPAMASRRDSLRRLLPLAQRLWEVGRQ